MFHKRKEKLALVTMKGWLPYTNSLSFTQHTRHNVSQPLERDRDKEEEPVLKILEVPLRYATIAAEEGDERDVQRSTAVAASPS